MLPTTYYRTHLQSLGEVRSAASRQRRVEAAMRLNMLAGDFSIYVRHFIAPRYKQPEVREKVMSWATSTPNVMTALCGLACRVYKKPTPRTLKGANVGVQDAYQKVLKQARWRVEAKTLERRVFATSVVIVVPVVRPGRLGPELHYDQILAHAAEIEPDPSNPWGSPRSVAFELPDPNPRDHNGPRHVAILDDEAWHFYEDDKKVNVVPHGAGVFPGVAFRTRKPPVLDDWWDHAHGEPVANGQLMAASIAARMRYVRHGQDRKQGMIIAEGLEKVPFQVAGAEGYIELNLDPEDVKWLVEDMNTPIEDFENHIRFEVREAARAREIPPDLVDYSPGSESIDETVSAQHHASLADIRDDAIDWFGEGEHELAWKTSLVLRAARHPASAKLEPDEVFDRFRIHYPDLTFVEHPVVRLQVAKAKIEVGISSTVREYAAEHDVTLEEAKDEVRKIAEEEIEIGSLFAEHNVPRNADDRKANLAQLQGRIGGMASGETRQQETNDDDEPDGPGRGERNGDGNPGRGERRDGKRKRRQRR